MQDYCVFREGAASFLAPAAADAKGLVFYNPLMRLNRDMAVAVANAACKAKKRFTIADPMCGCGVRSIRYALEPRSSGVRVFASDINRYAFSLAKRNVRRNRVSSRVGVEHTDANALLTGHGRPGDRFDLVDLDPFGAPTPFFDSTIRSIGDQGIVAATATDTAVLCGARPAACVRKYGARPLRTEYCHEVGVRIMLGALVSAGAKHDVGFVPLLAHRTAHYLRVYALARRRVGMVGAAIRQLGFLYHCFNCLDRGFVSHANELPVRCENCGKPNSHAGPLWTGSLYDPEFVQRLTIEALVSQQKDLGELGQLVNRIAAESRAPPLYFVVDAVCDKYSLPMPRASLVVKDLNERGYSAVPSHFRPNAIRTDSPLSVFAKTIRELGQSS